MSKEPYVDETRFEYYALPDTPDPQKRQVIDHSRLTDYRGKMSLKIEAVSPVFVGTGDYEVPEPEVNNPKVVYQPFAFVRDQNNHKLVIPGTSVKGAVRTYAEALSPSCERGKCKYDDRENKLCWACSIFGSLGFQGRISFFDTAPLDPSYAYAEKRKIGVRFGQKNKDHGGRRFYFHELPIQQQMDNEKEQPDNVKDGEWVEAVMPGRSFSTELIFVNLSLAELGLLVLAMGLDPEHEFNLKLGGGKNRRLGSVKFHLCSVIQWPFNHNDRSNGYRSLDLFTPVDNLNDWKKKVIQEYKNQLNQEKRKTVMDVADYFTNGVPDSKGNLCK